MNGFRAALRGPFFYLRRKPICARAFASAVYISAIAVRFWLVCALAARSSDFSCVWIAAFIASASAWLSVKTISIVLLSFMSFAIFCTLCDRLCKESCLVKRYNYIRACVCCQAFFARVVLFCYAVCVAFYRFLIDGFGLRPSSGRSFEAALRALCTIGFLDINCAQ